MDAPWTGLATRACLSVVDAAAARHDGADVVIVEVDGSFHAGVPSALRRLLAPHLRPDARLLDPAWWGSVLGRRLTSVDGPVRHSFTAEVPPEPFRVEVEQVAPFRLARLRRSVDADDWRRAGLDGDPEVVLGRLAEPLEPPAWMARATPAARRVEITAAGAVWVEDDPRVADVAVVVTPERRRRGHGRDVAAAAVASALAGHDLVRWRAEESDVAALALGDRLGFVPRARVLRLAVDAD